MVSRYPQAQSTGLRVNPSEKQNISKVAKNSIISGMGFIINLITMPITSVLTTRVLGAELYGIFSLIQSWGSLLSNVSSLGLSGTNLRFLPAYKADNDKPKMKGSIRWTLLITLIISLLITVIIILFPRQFCEIFVHRPPNTSVEVYETTIANAFRFYAISILVTALYLVFISSLNGLQEIKFKVAANEIIGSAVKVVSLVSLILLGLDLYAALLSNIIQDLAIFGFSLYFLTKAFPEIRKPDVKPEYELSRMNKFAAALFSKSLLNNYSFQLDILFLGYFNTIREVGIYTVALRLQPLIFLPHYAIKIIFDPMVAELYVKQSLDELGRLYKTVTKWAFSLSLPVFATIVLFSGEILNIFGKEFTEGFLLVLILSFGNVIHNLLGLSGNMIMMIGRIHVNLANSVVMAVMNIVVYFFLIKIYGVMGAAVGNALSLIILNVLTTIQIWYFLRMHPFKKSFYKPLLSIGISVLIEESLRFIYKIPYYQYTFIVYVMALWIFYVAGLFILRLDPHDVYVIRKITNKFPFLAKLLPKNL